MYELERRLEGCVKVCKHVNTLTTCMKKFIRDIASGERLTLAQWMRNFVDKHPEYTHNSILSKKVMDDLLMQLYKISCGELKDDNFAEIFPSWSNEVYNKEIYSKCLLGTK